ncbi:MAG: metallophosphoesterase [Proteobacteria bacterium]|nr:metallophosphoesterase [Pseudomonadota bacterium]
MVLALLSDIHSNLEALEACLRHARENGAERYAFLGDLVGYGADPQAVVDRIANYAREGSVVLKGNHDEAVRTPSDYMNRTAAEAIAWTRGALAPESKAYLDSLPLCVRGGETCFVHASAAHPGRWEYVDSPAEAARSMAAARTTYTFSGHVHDQALYFRRPTGKVGWIAPLPGRPMPVPPHSDWLALVGSVGQPRDGNPAAAYALFDPANATITFHRVPYDHRAAADKVRAAGLPAILAYRLEEGI